MLTVKTENRSGITLLRLNGDLDSNHCIRNAHGVPDLSEEHLRVVLDLADVPFINSGGLSELMQLVAAANTRGGRVILANPSPYIDQLFQTTQLDRFFVIANGLDEAVRKLTEIKS